MGQIVGREGNAGATRRTLPCHLWQKVTLIIDGIDQRVTTPEAIVAYVDLLGWVDWNANKGNVSMVLVVDDGCGVQLAFRTW